MTEKLDSYSSSRGFGVLLKRKTKKLRKLFQSGIRERNCRRTLYVSSIRLNDHQNEKNEPRVCESLTPNRPVEC